MNTSKPIKNIKTINLVKKYYSDKKEYKKLLIFLLLINTGLLINEIISLDIKDVLNRDFLIINNNSTIKRVYLNSEIKELIKIISKNRKPNEALFLSARKNRIERTLAFRWLKEAFVNLGLKEDSSPNALRKTFGYHYYQQTKDLSYLQWFFNQPTIDYTMKYIDIFEDVNLRKSYKFNL